MTSIVLVPALIDVAGAAEAWRAGTSNDGLATAIAAAAQEVRN
ncbi:hypothetical protein EKH55_5289 [Sinorhizobium alkalisoli]|nr:hypothetical protein EKH55_5289 [Sinorhizobium alkalisoli]